MLPNTIRKKFSNTKAFSDLVLISTLAVFVFVLAYIFDLCEPIVDKFLELKNWRLDELLVVILMLPFAFSFYTARRWLELNEEIKKRNRLEKISTGYSQTLEMVAKGVKLNQILEKLISFIEPQTNNGLCSVLLLDQTGEKLYVAAAPRLPKEYLAAIDGASISAKAGSCGTACYLGKPIFVADIATDPLWADYRALALQHGLRACWCLPILSSENKILGSFAMYYTEPKEPTDSEIRLIEVASRLATITIEREQSEGVLRQNAQRLESLREMDLAILAAHSPKALAQGLVQSMQQLLGCQHIEVALFDVDNFNALVFSSYANKNHGFISEVEVPISLLGIDEELRRGNVRLVDNPKLVKWQVSEQIEKLSVYLEVPLIADNQLLGLLRLGTRQDYFFSSENISVVQDVAYRMSVALKQVQLFEKVQSSQVRLQILSQRLVESQETERRRIANELHDEVGQALTAIKINLQASQRAFESKPAVISRLEESITIVENTLQQVRDIALNLRPSLLDDLGLEAALRWYSDRFAQRTGILVSFVSDLSEIRLSAELETVCFRAVQELLTNIARHAQASTVSIELELQDEQLRLFVYDDGKGFDVAEALKRAAQGGSTGLLSLQERVTLLQGRIEIKSLEGAGTKTDITIPVASL